MNNFAAKTLNIKLIGQLFDRPRLLFRKGLVLIILAFSSSAFAQELILNEVYLSETEAWIELINHSDTILNPSTYKLEDSEGQIFTFEDTILAPGAIWVHHLPAFSASPTLFRSTFFLKRNTESEVIDSIKLTVFREELNLARMPDLYGQWVQPKSSSSGKWNSQSAIQTEVSGKWLQYQAPDIYQFSPRDGAGVIVFKDELWLIGGWKHGTAPSELVSEVWKSKDGVAWEFVTIAPWAGRHQFGLIEFQNKLWVISGDMLTDVWSSADGITWELVTNTAPWGERYAPYVVAFDGKMWLMGGQNYPLSDGSYDINNPKGFNDVWSSTDGATWTLVTEHAAWGPRSMVLGQVVFDNKMWIMGGGIKSWETSSEYNDVWNSSDGVNWNLVNEHAPWNPRVHLTTTVYNNKIWMLSGSPLYPYILTNEVWSSPDGITWTDRTSLVKWPETHATSAVAYNGSLWKVVGFNSNETWSFTETDTYHLKPGGDITQPAEWESSLDHTSPKTFGLGKEKYVITSADTVHLNGNWNLNNPDVEVIVGDASTSTILKISNGASITGGRLSVNSHATVVSESASVPDFKQLSDSSHVVIDASDVDAIRAGFFYNLTIRSDHSVRFSKGITVLNNLELRSPGGKTYGDYLSVFGDLTLDTNPDSLNVRFLGSRIQHLSSNKDSIKLNDLLLLKQSGSIESEQNVIVNNHFRLLGTSLCDYNLKSIIVGGDSEWLGFNDNDQEDFVIKKIVIASQQNTSRHLMKKGVFHEMTISLDSAKSILFTDSEIKARSVNLTGDGSTIRFDRSSLYLGDELNVNLNSATNLSLGQLTIFITSDSTEIKSNADTLTLTRLSLNGGESAKLRVEGKILIDHQLEVKSGTIAFGDSSWLRFNKNSKLLFSGSSPQTVSKEFIKGTIGHFNTIQIDNPTHVNFTAPISVNELVITRGIGRVVGDSLTVRRIKTSGQSFISLADSVVLITYVKGTVFLPIALDTIHLPLQISTQSRDSVKVKIILQRIKNNTNGPPGTTLAYTWRVLTDEETDLRFKAFWSKNIEATNFDRDKANIVFVTGSQPIQQSRKAQTDDGEYFYFEDHFVVKDGFLMVGDFNSTLVKNKQNFIMESDDLVYSLNPNLLNIRASSALPVKIINLTTDVAELKSDTLFTKRSGIIRLKIQQAGDNFFFPKDSIIRIIVKKAELNVIAMDKKVPPGESDFNFKMRYEGFIGDDDEDDIIVKPVPYSEAGYSSPTGHYPILFSVGHAANYKLNYIQGDLSISNEVPAVKLLRGGSVTPGSATVYGQITNQPEGNYTYGLQWNSSAGRKNKVMDKLSKNFAITMSDLNENSEYEVRLFTLVESDTLYSNVLNIKTIGEDENGDDRLNVFPNPSRGIVSFEISKWLTEKASLKIFNTNGQLISQKEFDFSEAVDNSIDLSYLSDGIYHLVFSTKGKSGSKTIEIIR